MNSPNYNVGGVSLSLDDLYRLEKLKKMQETEGLPDDVLQAAATGRMFKLDTDPMPGFDVDNAMGFKSKIRNRKK